MIYQARGISFTIEELTEQDTKRFETRFLAMQNLTNSQKNNPNYLREVHVGNTIEEVKKAIDSFEGFYN